MWVPAGMGDYELEMLLKGISLLFANNQLKVLSLIPTICSIITHHTTVNIEILRATHEQQQKKTTTITTER